MFRTAIALCTLLGALLAVAGPANAETVKCQREIVKRATKFVKDRAKALQKCEDKVVKGSISGPCPDPKTITKLTKAESKMRKSIRKKCGGDDAICGTGDDDMLAAIGWDIGTCPDFEQAGCDNAIGDCDDIVDCLACVDSAAADQAIGLAFDEFVASFDKAVIKCQRTIGKETVKFLDKKTKTLQKCEDSVIKGNSLGPCPDANASSKIAKAESKLDVKICKQCGGPNKACGGGDDIPLGTIGFAATCPDVTIPGGASCAGSITTSQEMVDCLKCVLEFKADCHDPLTVPFLKGYPSECGGGQVSVCGNDLVEPGEECDGTDDAVCPGQCDASCFCPCSLPNPIPEVLAFVSKPGIELDSGWTGISHDLPGTAASSLLAATTSNCDTNLASPTCGQCDIDGPIAFSGASKNCICMDLTDRDSSSLADCDPAAPACGAGETCECFLGPPLPLSSGAVPVCVTNRSTAAIIGTANVADTGPNKGTGGALITLESAVHNGLEVAQPCPLCEGDTTAGDGVRDGTCTGGPQDGGACDVSGTSPFFGDVSFHCQPPEAANVGNLAIKLNTTTGTTSLATGTTCTAAGFGSLSCFCDTCATAQAEGCNTDADCPATVTCGGERCVGGSNNGAPCTAGSDCPGGGACSRRGVPTQPNQCNDAVCSPNPADPDNPNEGVCEAGPTDQICDIETFRGCTSDADCNPAPEGNCSDCLPGQTCIPDQRECFLDPIVRTGTPGVDMGTVVSTFCIPVTTAAAVNQVAGLPGPGALRQPTKFFRTSSLCGNGALDPNEVCDPPMDAACPGECEPDCDCLEKICGDDVVNQVSEECDGLDDSACPGACQGDCTCGPFCGDDMLDPGEECDGTDDAACPGECQASCLCPICGDDAVNQGSEECDGTDDSACPGACQGDCTCGPFCGDDNQDPGEDCDGTDTGSCPGTCELDCTCAAFCGDNVREGTELCDGTDDFLCPGKCQPDCLCPPIGELSFVVVPGADLDTGWTGTSHDFDIQAGTRIDGTISACDNSSDFECSYFANVGSHCSGDPSISCLTAAQCPATQACNLQFYGPPLPLSSGGVPVCVTNRHQIDVTGTYDLQTGSSALTARLSSLVHLTTNISKPCPICDCGELDPQDCEVGDTGNCDEAPGGSCTVHGKGPFGPTSLDCPPNPAQNVSGGGLDILFDPVATGTLTFPSDPNIPCSGAGFGDVDCWCPGQPQPSACNQACDGGGNDGAACDDDGDCPSGACVPLCRQSPDPNQAVGEGECVAGPIDQRCAQAGELGCTTDADCLILGPCITETRRCFIDPIVRVGTPDPTHTQVTSGSTFCIPATSSPAINNTAGLPGPGAIVYSNDITLAFCGDDSVNRPQEDCDGTDDGACPGSCSADCLCPLGTCGNGATEFGEQCDTPDDGACPGLCVAPGPPDECECPAVCGDGFKAESEECDPGTGGSPPPDDDNCPGSCGLTCTCPVAACGNGVVEMGEACDLPAVGCGPLQACNFDCTACFP